jgi:hypothetical protein
MHQPGCRPLVQGDAKEALAKQQANAAATLLHMGEDADAWSVLRHSKSKNGFIASRSAIPSPASPTFNLTRPLSSW